MEFKMEDLKEKLEEANVKMKKITETLEQKGDKVGLYSKLEWENLKGQYDELKKSIDFLTQKAEMISKVKKEKAEEKMDELKSKIELEALKAKYTHGNIKENIEGLKKYYTILFEKIEMIEKVRADKFEKHMDDAKSKTELGALSLKYEYENLVGKIKNIISEHKENK